MTKKLFNKEVEVHMIIYESLYLSSKDSNINKCIIDFKVYKNKKC